MAGAYLLLAQLRAFKRWTMRTDIARRSHVEVGFGLPTPEGSPTLTVRSGHSAEAFGQAARAPPR